MNLNPLSIITAGVRLLIVAVLLHAFNAHSAVRIEATVTLTNTPVAGDLIQANAQAYRWTNSTLASTNWIQVSNSPAASATNLYAHVLVNPFSNVVQITWLTSTSLMFSASFDTALSLVVTGAWATVSHRTNFVQTSGLLVMPYPTNTTEAFRTNQMTSLMNNLQNSSLIKPTASGAFARFIDTGSTQSLTNKTLTNATLQTPVLYDAVNRGAAFSSPGEIGSAWVNAENFGVSAVASNDYATAVGGASSALGASSTAVGTSALASNDWTTAFGAFSTAMALYSTALGPSTTASGQSSVAVGKSSVATGANSIAIGGAAGATAAQAIAIGSEAAATHADSIVIGVDVASTRTNEVRIGGSQDVVMGGLLFAEKGATNFALKGITTNSALVKGGTYTNSELQGAFIQTGFATNFTLASGQHSLNAGASWAIKQTSLTTIANGANVFEVGSNAFVRITGSPTAAWQLAGITGDLRDGRTLTLENLTGYGMTVLHESGLASTAGTRISCGISFELDSGSIVVMAYDATSSRWKVISSRNTVGSANGLVFVTVGTNYNGTNWAPLTTNIAAGFYPVGAFAQLASAGSNYLVLSGATANYTNLFSTAPAERMTTNAFGALATGTLTPVYSGYYLVSTHMVVWAEVDNNGDEIEIEIFVNDVAQDHTETHATLATGVKIAIGCSSLIYIPAGAAVTCRVRNESDASSSLPVLQSRLNIDSP